MNLSSLLFISKVIELNKLKTPGVISDISSVADDKVIETIISNIKKRLFL